MYEVRVKTKWRETVEAKERERPRERERERERERRREREIKNRTLIYFIFVERWSEKHFTPLINIHYISLALQRDNRFQNND